MPAPGDQYRDTKASINPFEETPQRVTEYTAQDIATLQSRLDKQLGPEYISSRPGAGGGKVHYLAAEKVINLANEVFGFNGWSSAIQNVQVDFVDESPGSGKISLGLSIIVRVTLKDGTHHEDIGYGHIENCKGKAAAFEKAKKEAATDALKRALRNFGNVLGNCLYDKDYLQRVTKLKIAPSKWDAENLHRHPDYAPIKKQSINEAHELQLAQAAKPRRMESGNSVVTNGSTEYGEDEFGGNLFDGVDFGHPDEVMLDNSSTELDTTDGSIARQNMARQQPARVNSAPNMQQVRNQPPTAQQQRQQPVPQQQLAQQQQQQQRPNNNTMRPNGVMPPPTGNNAVHQAPNRVGPSSGGQANNGTNNNTNQTNGPNNRVTPPAMDMTDASGAMGPPMPMELPPDAPTGFVTGRAAQGGKITPFDPHAESPSIRRTAGVSAKSAPIKRSDIGQPEAPPPAKVPANLSAQNAMAVNRPNFVNPAADANRRIGMPGGMQSPMGGNRGAYKPPAIKRPAPPETPSRQPLADMSNMQQNDGPNEAKKPRLEGPQDQQNNVPQSS
ncbi:hypothetical protein MBLNU457_3370t1 [Dothideomycetes sp. NU457]